MMAVTYLFSVIPNSMLELTDKPKKTISQDGRSAGRDWKP